MLELPLHLVANERPLINIDGTLFINMALWLLLFVLLRGLLWKPMLRLISAREKGTGGSRDDAKHMEEEAKKKRAEFEDAQKKARAAAQEEREKLRSEGARLETEMLSKTRSEVTTSVEARRAEIRSQKEALRTEVRATVPQLAASIATKVLGREVRS